MTHNFVKPLDVHQSKFPVNDESQILYCDCNYSLAISIFNKRKLNDKLDWYSIGMRWHVGISKDKKGRDTGWPKVFAHPVWMIIPEELSIPLLEHLKTQDEGHNEINHSRIEKAIIEIKLAIKYK